jgi:hypothetical protein
MSWNNLPRELEEMIIVDLPLFDLARLSSTRRVFQEMFRSKLQDEQKLRCELAVACFGRERISAIVTQIQRVLDGQILGWAMRYSTKHRRCRISEDGTFEWYNPAAIRRGREPPQGGEALVMAHLLRGPQAYGVSITAQAPHGSRAELEFSRNGAGGMIKVFPSTDGDLEGAALAQALVEEGLGRLPHRVGIHIVGDASRAGYSPTMSGFKTLIAPLMRTSGKNCSQTCPKDVPACPKNFPKVFQFPKLLVKYVPNVSQKADFPKAVPNPVSKEFPKSCVPKVSQS